MLVPAKPDADWSDSDEEDDRSDIETSVLLGIPDGEIEKQEDVDDAAVSRIGGHPAFLTSEPPLSNSQCKNCSFPMELLVQLWCPFENSPMDRALYVFGCSRGECQYKPGSVRAFRGLRYNATYAAKLEKKLVKQQEKKAVRLKAKEEEEKKKASAKINPFSMNVNSTPSGGLFGASSALESGIGSQLFGSSSQPETAELEASDDKDEDDASPPPESESESEDSEAESESESDKSILAAPAQTPSSSSAWRAAPVYRPPLYLSTTAEYVPPAPKPKLPLSAVSSSNAVFGLEDDDVKSGKSKKAETRRAEKEKEDAKAWNAAMEGYEDSLEVDKVFEKFAKVAGYEGEQCIRYELGGTPLPYANDSVFKSLFPSPSSASSTFPATVPARRTYDPKSTLISHCPRCGGPRTFECQLMPHLISVLHTDTETQTQTQTSTSTTISSSSQTSTTSQRPHPRSTSNDLEPEAVRKNEIDRLLLRRPGTNTSGGEDKDEDGESRCGMEWGTCMVFSCNKDCCCLEEKSKKEAKELWAEELVLVQWDE